MIFLPLHSRHLAATLTAFGISLAGTSAALSADMPEPSAPVAAPAPAPASGWTYVVTPYLWGTGLSGDVAPFKNAPAVHIDQSFSDILSNLNIAGFVNFWATNGRYGVYADVMYTNISEEDATGPVNIPNVGRVDNLNVKVGNKLFNGALFGSYRLANDPDFKFDALAGIRAYRVWTDLSVNAPSYNAYYSTSSTFGWVDPAVGFLAQYSFTDKMKVVGQADVGGFDVGSKISWQALAAFQYEMRKNMALSIGYKYQSVDYDSGGHVFDTQMQGPVMGVSFRF
ncbi:hypothetical protein FJU08_02025 [Martelella alba]|uniref:Outer membrane protein beta-barrel domain-containing protein n=1 Tax=Martelella alba TaxID=2590451 RepID=A0A506UJ90_9HYPH|nr:hypothetical protein [Martelella alba]TPW33362.1 hypothetical protein FJU08_02025 [Martelella alba]